MIAPEIIADVSHLVERLLKAGYRFGRSESRPRDFGNWFVDVRGKKRFRLIKDRGQYMINGPEDELRTADLWRAFRDKEEFSEKVAAWATGGAYDE